MFPCTDPFPVVPPEVSQMQWRSHMEFVSGSASGGSRNFLKGEDNTSDPSSFIANAHNEIYAFYTRKGIWFLASPTSLTL